MSIEENLNKAAARFDELQSLLAGSHNIDSEQLAKMGKELAELSPIVLELSEVEKLRREKNDAQVLLDDSLGDSDLRKLAEEEIENINHQLQLREQKLRLMLLPKDELDERNAILEVRAGTGGEEAALFAAELLRMYERYATHRDWKFEALSVRETDIGGVREATASISGKGVFARLKFESGVHRVQRVPVTETSGRIHTSAATVAVLAEAEEVDVSINTKDLRIDTYRSQGAGGQHVNKTDSAVRITHLPSNIVVQCQDEKSQHKNKAKAMKMLLAQLYDKERKKKDKERADDRKSQVGSGDRSERIRTYNFPQGRVTDHRINLTLHKLEQVLQGEDLDEVVNALMAEEQAEKLAALS